MKKLTTLLTVLALVASNVGHAQTSKSNKSMGQAANSGTYTNSNSFAWGVGLAALAVVGTVVGVTVAGTTSTGPTINH